MSTLQPAGVPALYTSANKLGYYATDSLICGIKLVVALTHFTCALYETGVIAGGMTVQAGRNARCKFNQLIEHVYVQAMYKECRQCASTINKALNTQPGYVAASKQVSKLVKLSQVWMAATNHQAKLYYRYVRFVCSKYYVLARRYQQECKAAVLAPAVWLTKKTLPQPELD